MLDEKATTQMMIARYQSNIRIKLGILGLLLGKTVFYIRIPAQMQRYLVEGLFFPKPKSKKAAPALEPFARTYWANSAQEAIRMASEDLGGGNWQKPPKASRTSEEERMREQGQPELPGFGSVESNQSRSGGKRVSTANMETRKSNNKRRKSK